MVLAVDGFCASSFFAGSTCSCSACKAASISLDGTYACCPTGSKANPHHVYFVSNATIKTVCQCGNLVEESLLCPANHCLIREVA